VRPASTYNVVVLGSGPAGSAAAWRLARSGLRVALVEREGFPRDKVCGDALIPDALGAIDAMGLRSAIAAAAVHVRELRVYAPGGRFVPLAGAFSCLPRLHLDRLLAEAAVAAGARLLEKTTAVAPLVANGRVSGCVVASPAGEAAIEAPFTLLATGANATTMAAFGVGGTLKPNAVAGRAYYRVPGDLAERSGHLVIAYVKALCPGYGWIFPGPDRRFNVGVGSFAAGGRGAPNLRDLWTRFIAAFEPAAALVRNSEQLSEFRGAPLRTGLAGARFGRPGLLVVGEAAATTYPATGEGIGKAMESGLLAAELVAGALSSGDQGDEVHERYAAEFQRRFAPRYAAYGLAETWSGHPWLLDVLARRANAGTFVRAELESLVTERGNPRRLFSTRGLVRSLLQ
jgi:geranylgeranyl reductase family protein